MLSSMLSFRFLLVSSGSGAGDCLRLSVFAALGASGGGEPMTSFWDCSSAAGLRGTLARDRIGGFLHGSRLFDFHCSVSGRIAINDVAALQCR